MIWFWKAMTLSVPLNVTTSDLVFVFSVRMSSPSWSNGLVAQGKVGYPNVCHLHQLWWFDRTVMAMYMFTAQVHGLSVMIVLRPSASCCLAGGMRSNTWKPREWKYPCKWTEVILKIKKKSKYLTCLVGNFNLKASHCFFSLSRAACFCSQCFAFYSFLSRTPYFTSTTIVWTIRTLSISQRHPLALPLLEKLSVGPKWGSRLRTTYSLIHVYIGVCVYMHTVHTNNRWCILYSLS